MAKHPTSSKVHREDHGPDDAFVNTVKRSYSWGRENGRVVAVVLALMLVLGVGAFWYISQQRQLEAQAASRLNEVQQSVASGNPQLAIRDLQAYLDRFGSTETADQARLILASILIEQEQPQEAVQALGELPGELDRPFGLAAARLEAAAHEEMGDIDAAVRTHLRIADRARFPYERREALSDAARLHSQNGEPDRAADLYERVVAMFDEDEAGRGYYEVWLAEARAAAREGAPAPITAVDTADTSEPAADTLNG